MVFPKEQCRKQRKKRVSRHIKREMHGIGTWRGVQQMTEQERHAVSQEERKEKIRARYRGVDRNELEFIPAKQKEKLFEDTGTKRVCAYCRVSTDDVNQTSSYELQKNHYEDMIKEHQGWELVGIYADEGISGTSLKHSRNGGVSICIPLALLRIPLFIGNISSISKNSIR